MTDHLLDAAGEPRPGLLKGTALDWEPITNNRFVVEIEEGPELNPLAVLGVTRPSLLLNTQQQADGAYQVRSYYWGAMYLTLLNAPSVEPRTTSVLLAEVDSAVRHQAAVKLNFWLRSLDAVGKTVESWCIESVITAIKFGKAHYSDGSVQAIELALTVKNCQYHG